MKPHQLAVSADFGWFAYNQPGVLIITAIVIAVLGLGYLVWFIEIEPRRKDRRIADEYLSKIQEITAEQDDEDQP